MRKNSTRAFFAESAALALFLLLALTVLVQIYGKARELSAAAKQAGDATLILQNADADFRAGTQEFSSLADAEATVTLYYNADGTRAEAGNGDYLVSVTVTPETTDAGVLYSAAFTVYDAEDEENAVAALTASRYVGKGAA